jgi:hypothetical protein
VKTVAVIPSRSNGPDHVIKENPLTGELICNCRAGQYDKVCWALDLVMIGRIHDKMKANKVKSQEIKSNIEVQNEQWEYILQRFYCRKW